MKYIVTNGNTGQGFAAKSLAEARRIAKAKIAEQNRPNVTIDTLENHLALLTEECPIVGLQYDDRFVEMGGGWSEPRRD